MSNAGSSRVNNVDDSGLKIDRNGQVHKKTKPICRDQCQTYVSHRELDLNNCGRDSGADIWRVLMWVMEVKTWLCGQTQHRSARQMGNLGLAERRFPRLPETTGAGVYVRPIIEDIDDDCKLQPGRTPMSTLKHGSTQSCIATFCRETD